MKSNCQTAAQGEMRELPIVVVDKPRLTVGAIRARARRIQRRGGLDLVVVDYLQLLGASRKSSDFNRVAEVTEITADLKALAKELDVPVLALSQLNRAVESRDDKRPHLADLRDSGCLSSDTTFLVGPGTVRYNDSSQTLLCGLNKDGAMVNTSSRNLPRRDSDLLRVQLRSGRFVDCTPDHPILTDRGWVAARSLTVDHAIACAASLPEPPGVVRIEHARWIGWMLGNGAIGGPGSPSFICSCRDLASRFVDETERLFGLTPRPHRHHCAAVWQFDITAGPVRKKGGNPCTNWLREHDLWGRLAPEKYVPDWFMERADNHSVAELLGGLIDTDGSVPRFAKKRGAVKYCTTSRRLAWQVLWAFLRLGIYARVDDGYIDNQRHRPIYTVQIADGASIGQFRRAVGLTGRKQVSLDALPTNGVSNHGDRLGSWVGKALVKVGRENGISQEALGYRDQGRRISKTDLRHFLLKIDGKTSLDHLTNPAIWWDRLRCLSPLASGPVFDREVEHDGHNFLANGIFVHNSIEQDADVVMFIYRHEYYLSREKRKTDKAESERANELAGCLGQADIIIAKHRNGPIDTVRVKFEAARTQFADWSALDERQEGLL